MNRLTNYWKTAKNGKLITIITAIILFSCVCCTIFMLWANLTAASPSYQASRTAEQVTLIANLKLITRSPIPTLAPSPTLITVQSVSTSLHCESASNQQAEAIRLGVLDISDSNNIGSVWAIKSGDYESVWFVASQITGPGIDPAQTIGLWAISGTPNNPGIVLSANPIAVVFSSYPDGSKTEAKISQLDDGAQQALTCAENHP